MGNPAVHLAAHGLKVSGKPRRIGQEGKHLSFQVTDGRHRFDAVWWNAPQDPPFGDTFDLAFVPEIDDYRGSGIRLKVLDCRPSHPAQVSQT